MPSDIDSINHVGMAVRNLAVATERFEAMGFQLTPYSPHSGARTPGAPVEPFSSGNRCLMFARNYLEILSSEKREAPAPRIVRYLQHHEGAHILCFNSSDLAAVDRRVKAAGIITPGLIPLQREVGTPDGIRTAKFERIQFAPDDSPEGFVQAATHLTPDYIYQPRYIEHPNRCYELSDALVVTDELEHFAAKYMAYIGEEPKRAEGVARFRLPLFSTLTLVDVQHAPRLLPGSLLPPIPGIAAVTFRTDDLGALRNRLRDHGFTPAERELALVVPAEQAHGLAIVFEAATPP
jgi:hypothetical protein